MLIWYQQKYPIGDWKQKKKNRPILINEIKNKKDRKQMNWIGTNSVRIEEQKPN